MKQSEKEKNIADLRFAYSQFGCSLDERQLRIWAATAAKRIGYGGITCVHQATGLSRATIHAGLADLGKPKKKTWYRCRNLGGGRKTLLETQPRIKQDLDFLLDPVTRGDPMSALRWTCKSIRNLEKELVKRGHTISAKSVARILKSSGYSLQGNRKTIEGKQHPDRHAQFEYINKNAQKAARSGVPFIPVDTKKK